MPSDNDEILIEDEVEEDEIPVEYDIATYPSDFTLTGIDEMWRTKDIIIPEFQREFTWSIKQSSLLIESFLLGLPVPPVFFYIDEENKNLVIDGQQRILSVVYYFEGYFGAESGHGRRKVFRLEGLDERSRYHSKKFDDLTDSDQRKLRSSVLRAVNVRQLSPEGESTSMYHIFERLNTGGTALKPQEIRNCVFRGEFVRVLRSLNQDSNWRLIMGKKDHDRYQKDVELVLRMFALAGRWREYEKPMKELLNKTMDKNREGNSRRVQRFIERFPETTRIIVEQLGEKPFHIRGPLNSSVLDSVFCTILENYTKLPKNLKTRFENVLNDGDFLEGTYGATTDTLVVRNRFMVAKKHFVD